MGGRLFQQYAADMWCKTEKEALDYIRRNQPQLRAELYTGLQDALHGDPVPAARGGHPVDAGTTLKPSNFFRSEIVTIKGKKLLNFLYHGNHCKLGK